MRTLLSLAFALLLSSVAQADTKTSFTLGPTTADWITVLSQDGVATPPSGNPPAVCPYGLSGGGGYDLWLLNDPAQPGQFLTLYDCQPTWGPLVQTGPTTSSQTTNLTGCVAYTWLVTSEVYSGTVVNNFVQKFKRCRVGVCPYLVGTGGIGSLTLTELMP